jgi:hypothetical protein
LPFFGIVFCLGQFGDEERGVLLGNPRLTKAREIAKDAVKAAADAPRGKRLPVIQHAQKAGATTLRQIADALNARGIPTARGGQWHASSVKNVLERS